MAKLVPLPCKKIEQKLRKLGFALDFEDGSTRYYTKSIDEQELVVQVHFHPGDKGIDVIKNILRNGEIDRDDWIKA